MTEFKVDVPGRFVLVDHALSRMERGSKEIRVVDGRRTLHLPFASAG